MELYAITRQKLLERAKKAVPFTGWSMQTLEDACRQEGINPALATYYFPEGVDDVVAAYCESVDVRMQQVIVPEHFATLKTHQKVKHCLMLRFQVMTEEKEAVEHTLAYYKLHPAVGTKQLWHTADVIWKLCGDTATDWNYYSKRTLLAGVYASTLNVFITDNDPSLTATEQFLDHRLADVAKIPKIKARFQSLREPKQFFDTERFERWQRRLKYKEYLT